MPCRSPEYEDRRNSSSGTGISQSEYDTIVQERNELLGAFCAICTEILNLSDVNLQDMLRDADVNGKCVATELWNTHVDQDTSRLRQAMDKYSKHELSIIRNILRG